MGNNLRKFGDFSTFKYGKMPDKTMITNTGKYPIYSGYRIVGRYNEFNIDKEQLVIVARGVGGTGDVKLSPEKCFLTNLSIAANIDTSVALPKYLYYFFQINNLRYLDSGSAQSQITISDLEKLELPIPSISTQQRVVEVLSKIDDKIELNNKINENLEQQAQAIFKHLPHENFSLCRADEVFDITIGKTPPRNEREWFSTDCNNIPWLSIADMGKGGVYANSTSEYLVPQAIKQFNIKLVPEQTVVLSFKLTIGRVSITNCEMATNEAIAHFNTDKDNITEYLYCYLKDFNFSTLGSTSSIATAVNSKTIKAMPFAMPPENVLSKFHHKVSPLLQLIRNNEIQNKKIAELRDSLLPKLMSGEINVSGVKL